MTGAEHAFPGPEPQPDEPPRPEETRLNDEVLRDEDRAARHYASIIESSDDAILSKALDGIILSWNAGAERLFGYAAEEAIGEPGTIIVPIDRRDEELKMLDAIRRGESIRQLETVRRRKDGSLVDVSLTASPIRNAYGRIVGATTIARDIAELKKARERQQLLLREMSHRVKNLFALTSSVVALSARSAGTVQELANSARERLAALARAHSLTFSHGEPSPQATTLQALIHAIIAPFDEPAEPRISITGSDSSGLGRRRDQPRPPPARIRDQRRQIRRLRPRPRERSRSIAPTRAAPSSSPGPNAADRRSPSRRKAKDSAACSRASPSRASSAARSRATGIPRGSRSACRSRDPAWPAEPDRSGRRAVRAEPGPAVAKHNEERMRQGVTGHNVVAVLIASCALVIVLFILVAIFVWP